MSIIKQQLTQTIIEELRAKGVDDAVNLITYTLDGETKQAFIKSPVEIIMYHLAIDSPTLPVLLNVQPTANLFACRKLSEYGIDYLTY